jgi:hypothetical protein
MFQRVMGDLACGLSGSRGGWLLVWCCPGWWGGCCCCPWMIGNKFILLASLFYKPIWEISSIQKYSNPFKSLIDWLIKNTKQEINKFIHSLINQPKIITTKRHSNKLSAKHLLGTTTLPLIANHPTQALHLLRYRCYSLPAPPSLTPFHFEILSKCFGILSKARRNGQVVTVFRWFVSLSAWAGCWSRPLKRPWWIQVISAIIPDSLRLLQFNCGVSFALTESSLRG